MGGPELEYAREHSRTIVPIFIHSVAGHDRFRDYLGVDATSPQAFADAVHGLMRDLFLSFDLELPPADPDILEAGLRDLAKEEPGLAPLILGCLDSKGLHWENCSTVSKSAFHPLDDALNTLFDLMPNTQMAELAAYGFSKAGAGTKALLLWIAQTGDGGSPLRTAVGTRLPEPVLIETAIKLLRASTPPNNGALATFIRENDNQLDQEQRHAVFQLVTWPLRNGKEDSAVSLGVVALEHFPDAFEIQHLWRRWIEDGVFDGREAVLGRILAQADREGRPGWDGVQKALRSHVREYMRSGDKQKVWVALDYLRAAANENASVRDDLLREACPVGREWEEWEKRDRDTAELMCSYVLAFAEEAAGDRNWVRAMEKVKGFAAFRVLSRQTLEGDNKEPSGG